MTVPLTPQGADAQFPRGIDHVGLTVVDIEAAARFLIEGLGATVLYETLSLGDPPLHGRDLESAVRLPSGASIEEIRMYKLGNGPGVELFRYKAEGQREAARGCDLGWQHISMYVDDLESCVERAVAAGAIQLHEPWLLMNAESGANNRFCFLRTPFGPLLEFVSFPSDQAYEVTTGLRRWKPARRATQPSDRA